MAGRKRTTSELKALIEQAAARIREREALMRRTPVDTLAYRAMEESRPGLLRFRARIDDELAARGA